MADDLSNLPIMDSPQIDIPNTFEDWSSATINLDDSFSWGSIWDAITSPTAKQLLSLGSGLYGLYESGQQRNLAKDAMAKSDPFGPYRGVYAQQLMSLMADPSSITKDPGYQFQLNQGGQAIERFMSTKGMLGSGNEGIALEEYGQQFGGKYLNDKISQLAGLAGANISPNYAPGLQAYSQGLDTASAALASLGYGLTRGGSSAGTPGHPNAAGGEAAKIGQGLGVVSSGAKLASSAGIGGTASKTVSNYAGDLGNIMSGIAEGGVGGYGKAALGAADLAGVNVGGVAPYVQIGADVAKGNYTGAGMGLVGLAVGGGLPALAFAATELANKAFFNNGSEARNMAAFTQVNPLGLTPYNGPLLGRAGRISGYIDQKGNLLSTNYVNDLAGSWYGAAVAPDGNQADWAQKYQNFLSNPQYSSLPKGYTWDPAQRAVVDWKGRVYKGD